ncbi:MAG TPA: ribosomal RNA small subunit methyltransferase A [Deltaproteobacteria bacterium]|nr:MAG: ribosomal RNA small subunit methyltransferase A [Deltaproteobacteria bacterium GWA2_45_12]HBF13107.1 ribosomal RNA small subunit methyltransferase A [Deltaproteobacteria bacterium]
MTILRPKKSLGQNFLVDGNYQRKIFEAVCCTNPSNIMEIGPGREALTQHFVKRAGHLLVVEKDRELASHLIEKYSKGVRVVEADFLECDLSALFGEEKNWVVVGNLPYNVASQIFIKLVQNRKYFSDLFLMFQKEMAARFVAKPSTKDYGLLSLWAQIYTAPKILFHLPPTVFKPQPKVNSSFVHFKIKTQPLIEESEEENFWILMRLLFQQRRKTMGSVLKKKKIDFPESYQKVRAEELTVEELVKFLRSIP